MKKFLFALFAIITCFTTSGFANQKEKQEPDHVPLNTCKDHGGGCHRS